MTRVKTDMGLAMFHLHFDVSYGNGNRTRGNETMLAQTRTLHIITFGVAGGDLSEVHPQTPVAPVGENLGLLWVT